MVYYQERYFFSGPEYQSTKKLFIFPRHLRVDEVLKGPAATA